MLFLQFFLLPLVLSAALEPSNTPNTLKRLNHLDKIIGASILQFHIFHFLRFKEKIKFLITCQEYYKFLFQEYEELFKQVPVLNTSFKSLDTNLKFEISKLYKYFNIEIDFRQSKDKFKFSDFYPIIDGSFFTDPKAVSMIKSDNMNEFRAIFGEEFTEDFHLNYPHFPQISLNLLKSPLKPFELKSLIKNAVEAPHLFDMFFKHLAKNIYGVKRDNLPCRIKEEYSDFNYPRALADYQSFIDCAFARFGRETLVICFFITVAAYLFIPFQISFERKVKIWFINVSGLMKLINKIYQRKYENFAEYNIASLRRYLKATDSNHRYFKERNYESNEEDA